MPSYGLGLRDDAGFDFNLPSGNTCLMKRADLQGLIASGVIDSIDTLVAIVQTEHVDRVKKGKKTRHIERATGVNDNARAALELMKDRKRWAEVQSVVDGVVVQCVLQPKVLPVPAHEGESVPEGYQRPAAGEGKFYVDEVSLTDRLAIFTEAMQGLLAGQAAMEPFRAGSAAPVAGVGDGEDTELPTERTAGDS